MVVSMNRGTSIQIPIHNRSCHESSQKGPPFFLSPPDGYMPWSPYDTDSIMLGSSMATSLM